MANAVHRFVIDPAGQTPDTVALTDAITGATHSRAQMLAGVQGCAAELLRRGIKPEQRIMLCCADTAAFLWWFWGAMWIGAIPVPVSTMLTAKDYAFLLDDSRAVGLIYSQVFADTAGAAGADRQRTFLRWTVLDEAAVDGAGFSGTGVDEAGMGDAGLANPGEPFDSSDDDAAFWLYTSGTTGFPKGAIHRHIDMAFCTERYAIPVLSMAPADVIYSVAKLFFAYGLGNSGYFPAGTGAQVVLNPARPTPDDIAAHVTQYRPSLYFGVPSSYAQLLAADLPADTFASVRLAVSAGEPLPAAIHARFAERFGVEILDGFGTTELCHIAISNRPGASVGGTSGTVLAGYEVSLRDEAGNEVPDGEPGALHVAGESITTGYWNRTAQNRATLQGRFLATGDTYLRNPDETLQYLGRTDDMLKVSGIWVSPTEVEACILEMDEVVLAAVVGAEDEAGLTKTKAFVVPNDAGAAASGGDPALATAVREHVKQRLASFKAPHQVEVVAELPQTATGKIKRYLLR